MHPRPNSPTSTVAWLGVAFLLLYLLTWSSISYSMDELSALSVAETFAAGGGWHANQMEYDQVRTPPQNSMGLDGNLYSKKGIGHSLVPLPLWLAGRALSRLGLAGAVQTARLTGVLLGALAVALFALTAHALGYGRRTVLLGTVAFGAGTLLWPYARTLFGEVFAAFGLVLAFYGAARSGSHLRSAAPCAGGVAAGLGLAVVTLAKSSNAVVAPLFLLYLAWVAWAEWRQRRPVARSLCGLAAAGGLFGLSVLATVAYNRARFGTWLTFPLEPYERFSTPLATGLIGLFLSPGKGLLWYTPLLLLALAGLGAALAGRVRGRRGFYLLAAASLFAPALLYAAWFDWAGGRAWGPRMIAWTAPAVALLALPALDWLPQRERPLPLRLAVGTVLLLSVLAQVPGVLVNFEWEEIEDFRRGFDWDDMLWNWSQAPPFTYWAAIASPTRDPLLSQPFFWRGGLRTWTVLAPALLAAALLALAWRRPRWLWGAAACCAAMSLALPLAAYGDPRWDETLVAASGYIRANAAREDVVVYDVLLGRDVDGRAWYRANTLPAPPAAISWRRRDAMSKADGATLARWLEPHARLWLFLEYTGEGDGTATESWLDAHAYRGRQAWFGTQRLVEYLLPAGEVATTGGPLLFSGAGRQIELLSYRVAPGKSPGLWLVDLAWTEPPDPGLRFSVQALAADGSLRAQVDSVPGRLEAGGVPADRVGIAAPQDAARLILKLYDAESGAVLAPPQAPEAGYAPLADLGAP